MSGRGIAASALAFQANDAGSTPAVRSIISGETVMCDGDPEEQRQEEQRRIRREAINKMAQDAVEQGVYFTHIPAEDDPADGA